MNSPRYMRVAQVLAMAGSVGVGAGLLQPASSCAQTPRPVSVCPASNPTNATSCAGYRVGLECEWYGAIQCLCEAPAPGAPPGPQWRCITRSVPGPLAPPELLTA